MTKRRAIYTIDCETDPFDGTTDIAPFLWDIYDGTRHHTYETVKDVHAFIECHKGLYYAHNGGKFDFHQGEFCKPLESGQELLVINGRVAQFHMCGSEFRDSFCILPHKLSDLGAKLEIDYGKLLKANRKQHWEEIINYLHADTEVLHQVVTAFIDAYGASITLAGAAIKQLRKRLPQGEDIPSLKASDDADLRPFYFGGRVEAFKTGIISKAFKVYDISSAYPFAMKHPHAWGPDLTTDRPRKGAPIDPCAFYAVQCVSLGALPSRVKGGGLSFPVNKKIAEYNCTGWELLAGVETGTVRQWTVMRRLSFGRTCQFNGHVDHFYRLKSDEPKGSHGRMFAKLMLNSAYGKLGSDPRKYSRYMVIDETERPEYIAAGWSIACCIGGRDIASRDLDDYEMKRLHVGAAASITGFVRAKLWRQICEVRERGGQVIYCDTDSVMCRGVEIATGTGLGDWELDADCVSGAIAGKKLYAIKLRNGESKISCKGVRLTAAQIESVARGNAATWTAIAPSYSLKRTPKIISRKIKRTG